MGLNPQYIIDLTEIYKADEELIGKKAHQLGVLQKLHVPIPEGFVITAEFFKEFLRATGIDREISKAQALDHPAISDAIKKLFAPVKEKIMRKQIPQALSIELHKFYRKLSGIFGETSFNIYSSAKDNKSILFHNIKGDANLVIKIKNILAHYLDRPFSVIVQKAFKAKNKKTIVTNDPSIDDENLSKLIRKIQRHFYFPQEIEYAVEKNKVYITSIKPFTGIIEYKPAKKVLIKGIPLNPGIVTGQVKIFRGNNVFRIIGGDIIVTPKLNSSAYKAIQKARAVIIDSMLPKAIDKILYKKSIKIPTIEGAQNASILLHNGHVVTVNGITGEVYSGGLIY